MYCIYFFDQISFKLGWWMLDFCSENPWDWLLFMLCPVLPISPVRWNSNRMVESSGAISQST